MLEGSSGSSYRLVIRFHDRNVVFGASPFASYKQAVGHVSTAIRRHARDGRIAKICLQRGVQLAASAEHVSHWVTLEQWDGDVVQRILAQPGDVRPVEVEQRVFSPALSLASVATESCAARPGNGFLHPHRPADKPKKTAAPSTEQIAAAAPPEVSKHGGKGHRWHVGVTLALAVAAWLVLAVVLADGRVGNMLGIAAASRPAEATELPFDAPAAEDVREANLQANKTARASQHHSGQ